MSRLSGVGYLRAHHRNRRLVADHATLLEGQGCSTFRTRDDAGTSNMPKENALDGLFGDVDYKHAEAFMLMSYQCDGCGTQEQVWNSRDGVTPFIVRCDNCNGAAKHNTKPIPDKRITCRDQLPLTVKRVFVGAPDNPQLLHRRAILAATR